MFKKDFLVLDIEASGVDITQHEMIQLAGVLLDKKTLRQKKSFSSFIKPKHWESREREAMEVNGITWEQLKNAPPLKTVLKKFNTTFGADVTPTTYGGNLDIIFLPASYKMAGLKYPFDYHTFNLWVLCYAYMARKNKLNDKLRFHGFSLEDVARALQVPLPEGRHDALVDCEFEAAVFRKLISAR